jgi:hypothetical protein
MAIMRTNILVLIAMCFVLVLQVALAQGRVTVYGSVIDPSGAAIAGATITIVNNETAQSRQATASADGSFVFPDLVIGSYKVTAQAPGFKTFVENLIQLRVDENRRVNVQMEVGALSENVTVSAEAAQVDTRSGTITEVVDSARIVELPLNGRNALQLQYLVPGAGGVVAPGQGQNESVSINGSRPNTNNYTLDGADNEDPFFNTPGVFPNPDALAEFSMQTNAYAADRGRNAGALMNAVTKSGTNQFHGALFEFLRNDHLNARNFFANSVPPFKRNQYGGTLGGPIRRDKTFFFVSYQGTRERSSPGSTTPTVFSEAQRRGDFSAQQKALKDPLGGAFPKNIIPASRLSKPSLNFLDTFVPLPNAPNGLYSFAGQQAIDDSQFVAKGDHTFTSNHQISGRLLWDSNDTNQVVNNVTLPGFLAVIKYHTWNASFSDSYIFSPSLINVFTFGFNDITRDQVPLIPAQKTWGDLGAGIVRAADGPIGYDTQVDGYFHPQSRYPLDQFRKGFQYSDGLNWTRGGHSFKFGGDIRQSLLDMSQTFQSDPLVRFRATFTGDAAADFMLGQPTTVQQQSQNGNRPRTLEIDAYAQDDWKISRRLTLNLGLRWDPYLPFHDLDHQFSQVRMGQQSVVFPTAPPGYVFPDDPGVSETTQHNSWNNWAPRFGFAFDPAGNGKTSIRGGYGIFYSEVRQQANNQLSTNQPFSLKLVVTNPSGGLANPYSDTGNPFPYQSPTSAEARKTLSFFLPMTVQQWDPNFRDALVQQWNLNIQRQFGDWVTTVAYVGSSGRHLFMSSELNPGVYGKPGKTLDARRLYAPYYSSLQDQMSAGNSSYNALQLTESKRFSHGLTVLMNYTWSKLIDDASDDGGLGFNPFNLRANRGLSDNDVPHRFAGSFIWELPRINGRGAALKTLVNGWELNGIVTLQRGSPFNVVSDVDASQSGVGADHADLVGNWQIAGDRSKAASIDRYFNTSAFVVNAPGTFGNLGRNVLRGPGMSNIDLGTVKTFAVTERWRVQLRGEAFNLLNHANLGTPNANVSSAQFGRITSAGNPRVMQVALKVVF